MTNEQFEKFITILTDIKEAIGYVGNMLEDHARHSSADRANISSAVNNIKQGK